MIENKEVYQNEMTATMSHWFRILVSASVKENLKRIEINLECHAKIDLRLISRP